jgi:hypothetical protein
VENLLVSKDKVRGGLREASVQEKVTFLEDARRSKQTKRKRYVARLGYIELALMELLAIRTTNSPL